MEKLKKKNIEIYIGESLGVDVEYSYGDEPSKIEDLLSFLNKAKSDGATDVKFLTCGSDGETWCIDLYPLRIEEESDIEFEQRKKAYLQEQDRKTEEKEESERREFERLKKKFKNE